MLGSLGKLFVEIGADLSGLKSGVVKTEKEIKGLAGSVQKHGMAIGAAMTGVGVTSLAMAYKCVDSFKTMDSAMAGVRKTTGMTKEEIAVMRAEFIDLSTEMPKSAAELAGIGQVAGQLGITGKGNIMEFTQSIAMMSTAFDMSAEDAATAMAKVATIYDIPIKEVSRLGSAVNVLGNTTAATEAQIMAYSMSLGASANQLGFTATQSLAMGATLISMGMDASNAGSRLNSAFTQLGEHTEEAAAMLGMTEEQFKKAFGEDPMAVLQALIAELGKIDDPLQRNTTAANVFGAVGAKAINGLAGNLDGLDTNLKNTQEGFEENKSLTEEYANATDTLAAKLEIAKNKQDAAAIAMGEAMAPAAIMAADATAGFAGIIAGLPEPLQEIAGMGILAAGGIGSIGGPLMMMMASAPGAVSALGDIGKGMKKLSLAFLTNPVALAVMAIIAVLLLLKYAWDNNIGDIQGKTAALWQAIKDAFTRIKALIAGKISDFRTAGSRLMEAFKDGISQKISDVVNTVEGALEKVRSYLPFSDAKVGPLSDLTKSGSRMMETFASGMDSAGNLLNTTFAANAPQPAAIAPASSGATTNDNSFSVNIQQVSLSKDYGFNEMIDDIRARRMRDGIRFV